MTAKMSLTKISYLKTTAWIARILLGWLLLALPATLRAQFTYTTSDGTITITGYTGPDGDVVIPDTINGRPVTRIGESAFVFKTGLTRVTIPSSVTKLGDYAFLWCRSLTGVTIPSSVTNIGNYAFQGCDSVTAFDVDAANPAYASADGVLFDKNQTKLIQCPALKTGDYTIPSGVSSIVSRAFLSCINLVKVTIPSSVTSIGIEAFQGCPSLVAFSVDTDNSAYSGVEGVLFNKSRNLLIQWPRGRTGDYTIPQGVIGVGDGAFNACSLTSVTIPNSVTTIGLDAFYGCGSLEGVYFQGSAPKVGDNAFYLADKATVYYLPGTTGWKRVFGGRPTEFWSLPYPLILSGAPGFGPTADGFGFSISWATGTAVVVEATSGLAAPNWVPVGTNTLIAGTSRFTDRQSTNYPARLYRVVSQ